MRERESVLLFYGNLGEIPRTQLRTEELHLGSIIKIDQFLQFRFSQNEIYSFFYILMTTNEIQRNLHFPTKDPFVALLLPYLHTYSISLHNDRRVDN